MKVVKGNTVDRGLQALLTEMNKPGNFIETDSRNGPVRRFRGPATIMWLRPQYRVSFDPLRDANPAFHLFESLWMLSGENDVARPQYFASQMSQFSDDGLTFHGAYGNRWVKHFGYDQIRDYVIPALRKNNEDRRAVIGMWDPTIDIPAAQANGKDVPCNTMATFDAAQKDGKLHFSCFNRSNDSVWGATGANAVHFPILQEYVASACDLGVGVYEQISTNMHLYLELNEVSKKMLKVHNDDPMRELPYFGMLSPLRHRSDGTALEWQAKFDADNALLMANHTNVFSLDFQTYFFRFVVKPVITAFNCYKNSDDMESGMFWLTEFSPPKNTKEPWFRWHDWNIAMYKWLDRLCDKRNAKIPSALKAESNEDYGAAVRSIWKNVGLDGNDFKINGGQLVRATLTPRQISLRGINEQAEPYEEMGK